MGRMLDRFLLRWKACFRLYISIAVLPGFLMPIPASALLLSDNARAQLEFLYQQKQSLTSTQKKIDLNLILEQRRRAGSQAIANNLPRFNTSVNVKSDGTVAVDIKAKVTKNLLDQIKKLGGSVVNSHPRFNSIRAYLPLGQIERFAASSDVVSIRRALPAFTRMTNVSEGDVAHAANTTRISSGADGAGVTACAISDSVDSLATLQGTGDLPNTVTVLAGQSGNPGSSEGTALLEIMHDLAPGASLMFATGVGGEAQMAQNILDLAAAGCKVIVDDIGYFAEPVFQDGVIAQAVETVVKDDGVLYFSSAGNSGNLNDSQSGVWEGDFNDSGNTINVGVEVPIHDFDPGAGTTDANVLTTDSPFLITLQWSDPQDQSGNDFDLFLFDTDGGFTGSDLVASSTNPQTGTQDPFEFINSIGSDDANHRLVIAHLSGNSDRFLHLNTHRGRLAIGTDGQIFGHPAAESAFAVAAVDYMSAGGAGGVFDGTESVETFSSDGPRRIFFNPDGSPIGGGAAGFTNGLGGQTSVVRDKPDITAADGVSTATPGFNPFFGTSASAPHSAAIAALFAELYPGITEPGLDFFFRSKLLDIEDPGFDRDSGSGIFQADTIEPNMIFTDGFESGNTSAWTSN